jgi:membrane associated rhomboid family serine protease
MIPLRDVIPSRTPPVVTVTLIGANAAAFVFERSLAPQDLTALIETYGVVPAAFSWSTVLTSMFLHGGLLHFVGNMLYLWIFGDNVEDRMGHGRFLLFYLLCGGVAAMVQVWTSLGSTIPMIGASGAIAGVMGAYIVLFPHSRVLTLVTLLFYWNLVEIPAVYLLGFWFLVQLLSGVGTLGAGAAQDLGGVAFWAHVSGFVAGILGVFGFRRRERQRYEWWDA